MHALDTHKHRDRRGTQARNDAESQPSYRGRRKGDSSDICGQVSSGKFEGTTVSKRWRSSFVSRFSGHQTNLVSRPRFSLYLPHHDLTPTARSGSTHQFMVLSAQVSLLRLLRGGPTRRRSSYSPSRSTSKPDRCALPPIPILLSLLVSLYSHCMH